MTTIYTYHPDGVCVTYEGCTDLTTWNDPARRAIIFKWDNKTVITSLPFTIVQEK